MDRNSNVSVKIEITENDTKYIKKVEVFSEILINNCKSFEAKPEIVKSEEQEIEISEVKLQPRNYKHFVFKEKVMDEGVLEDEKKIKTESQYNGKFENCDEANKNDRKNETLFTLKPSSSHLLKQQKEEDNLESSRMIHTCKICNFLARSKSLLSKHINSLHNKLRIIIQKTIKSCLFCDMIFISRSLHDDHLLNQHKLEIKRKLRNLITSKIYNCKLCGYKTTIKLFINTHRATHRCQKSTSQIECKICTKMFSSKSDIGDHYLKNHKTQIVNNIKDFITNKLKVVCQFCDMTFKTKWSRNFHLLKHHKKEIKSNAKKYLTCKILKCKKCKYQTLNQCDLKNHFDALHNEGRSKIKCTFCDKSFTKIRWVDDHILKQHQHELKGSKKDVIRSKVHKCKTCDYATTNSTHLNRHFNSFHNKRRPRIPCKFCGKSFKLKKSAQKHQLKEHKKEVER